MLHRCRVQRKATQTVPYRTRRGLWKARQKLPVVQSHPERNKPWSDHELSQLLVHRRKNLVLSRLVVKIHHTKSMMLLPCFPYVSLALGDISGLQ